MKAVRDRTHSYCNKILIYFTLARRIKAKYAICCQGRKVIALVATLSSPCYIWEDVGAGLIIHFNTGARNGIDCPFQLTQHFCYPSATAAVNNHYKHCKLAYQKPISLKQHWAKYQMHCVWCALDPFCSKQLDCDSSECSLKFS